SCIESMWLSCPARLNTYCAEAAARVTAEASAMSATTTSAAEPAMLRRLPPWRGTNESTTVTEAPAASRARTVFDPMKPRPPVTRQWRPAKGARSTAMKRPWHNATGGDRPSEDGQYCGRKAQARGAQPRWDVGGHHAGGHEQGEALVGVAAHPHDPEDEGGDEVQPGEDVPRERQPARRDDERCDRRQRERQVHDRAGLDLPPAQKIEHRDLLPGALGVQEDQRVSRPAPQDGHPCEHRQQRRNGDERGAPRCSAPCPRSAFGHGHG